MKGRLSYMNYITNVGNWYFEVKDIRAIKTDTYGDPYSATATLRIVDGVLHVENLLSQRPSEKTDRQELESFILSIGFTEYSYINFVDGEAVTIKRVLK